MGYEGWKSDDQIYAEGAAYFSAGDYLNAYNCLYHLAQKGHAAAQYCVGVIHFIGIQGMPAYKDDAKARDYLQRSAKGGCKEAVFYLEQYMGGYEQSSQDTNRSEDTQKSQEETWFLQACEAYRKMEFGTAAGLLDQAARAGYVKAQMLLAHCYENGRGLESSLPYAAYWYGQAGVQGDPKGQLRMGMMYLRGIGVDANRELAMQWLELAAGQGDPEAMDAVLELEQGYAMPEEEQHPDTVKDETEPETTDTWAGADEEDSEEADAWDDAAKEDAADEDIWADEEDDIWADEEDEEEEEDYVIYRKPLPDRSYMARSVIKFLKENDEEKVILTAKNATSSGMDHYDNDEMEEALEDLQIGAQLGNPYAQYLLGLMYKYGNGVEEDLRIAKEWFQRAAELGLSDAEEEWAELSHIEIYTAEDYMRMSKEANEAGDKSAGMRYLGKAADKGAVDAQLFLGIILTMEPGENNGDGIEYLEGAAEQGSKEAWGLLGNLYQQGKIVPEDIHKAMEYWEKASELGHTESMVRLGTLLVSGEAMGEDIPKDGKRAFQLFNKAAQAGDAGGKRGLGVLYALGEGVAADRSKAKMYLQEAMQEGDETAKELYNQLF